MGNSLPEDNFTVEQRAEIGRLVLDHWGGHIVQTGMTDNLPYIYFQMSPNGKVTGFVIDRDGTSRKTNG